MTAYSNFLKLRSQALDAASWDVQLNENHAILDFVAGAQNSTNRLISGGVVSAGIGLNANHALALVIVAGVRYEVAADSVAVTGSSLNYIYIDDAGAVVVALAPPTGDYVPLAVVDAGAAAVDRVGDCRPQAPVVVPAHNVFINGDFAIDQEYEGAGISVSTASKYLVDMVHASYCNHTAVVTARRVAGFGGFAYAGKLTVTTEDTLSSGKFGHCIRAMIEYRDCQLIAGRYLAFAFKFAATLAGTYSLAVLSGDQSNSYVTTFDYATGGGAVQVVPMLIPVPSSKVVEGTNNRGLIIDIARAAIGTYATSTLNQWQAGAYFAATGSVDWEVTAGNYISVTGLYGGPDMITSEFPHRPAGEERALCQRYFRKSYSKGVAIGNTSANGCYIEYATRNTASGSPGVVFPVEMRAAPTVTLYAQATGTPGNVSNNGDKVATASGIGTTGFYGMAITSGDTAYAVTYHYVADARM